MQFKTYKALKRFSVSAVKIVTLVFLSVVTYRIANSQPSIDLSKFDFSDLLALIMGLFAMGLSVAFYFKATDTSNKFYDNTYKFTEDTSKILGRIEAGFGERLRHMDEGYTQLSGRIDKLKIEEQSQDVQIQEQKEIVRDKEVQYQQAIDELLQKSRIDATEKEKLRKQLEVTVKERENAQGLLKTLEHEKRLLMEEFHNLSRAMSDHDKPDSNLWNRIIERIPPFRKYLRIVMSEEGPSGLIGPDILKYMPKSAADDLRNNGYTNDKGDLTEKGMSLLMDSFNKYF